ncbi:MAG: OmpA family protein [Pseudomonadota bacterium]
MPRYKWLAPFLSLLILSGCASLSDRQSGVTETRVPIAQIDRGVLIWLPDHVLFDTGQAEFKQDLAAPFLDKVARLLREKTTKNIALEGHTDNVGTAEYNLDLSRRRAKSVRDAFLARGVPAQRMALAGLGMDQPVAPNDTEIGRTLNRRVEVIVLDEQVENITRDEPANTFEAAFERLKALFGQTVARDTP